MILSYFLLENELELEDNKSMVSNGHGIYPHLFSFFVTIGFDHV